MVDILEPYTQNFQRVAEKFDLTLQCSTCLWMMHDLNVSTPPIGFSQRAVKFIAAVGAFIDVDTYRDDGDPYAHNEGASV